jgi:hypothetical protein
MLINVMPVDYVSRALVHLSRQPSSYGQIFHFANPNPAELHDVWEWIREYGYELEVLPYPEWRQHAIAIDPSNALWSVLPILLGDDSDEFRYPEEVRPQIDTRNSTAALAGSGIECPPVSRDLCFKVLTYLIEVGFLDPPGERRRKPQEAVAA